MDHLRRLFEDPIAITLFKGVGAMSTSLLAAISPTLIDLDFYVRLLAGIVALVSSIIFLLSLAIDVAKKIRPSEQNFPETAFGSEREREFYVENSGGILLEGDSDDGSSPDGDRHGFSIDTEDIMGDNSSSR